ncbi:DUF2306 domain-containing protein [uncultured Sphingorhabdus sp.]|uniref:DUF2306 domain-containing protein n=1 Tax=uncultured Sphingorhabdus sp. TaxID=1686106 RepID=UPI002628A60C|nr:DUF2306 domain-containing protein [uncultured Sphingorhabdus sp.]HMS20978.1 DUF2306 domain-containing protein [Sphingorhabdus sp.]
MARRLNRPASIFALLYFATLLGTILGLVQVVQIPLGALPEDSQRLSAAPVWHFMHVLGGSAFGLLGPIQFSRVLMGKYGLLHRVIGRVFVVSGAMISLSSLGLLWHFPDTYSVAVNYGRLLFGIALGVALTMAMLAIRRRDFTRHRNWMIRAYAVGIGTTIVSMIFFPIYVITGEPPKGLVADILFLGSWLGCILLAESLVRRL